MARRSDHTREELEKLAITAGWQRIDRDGLKAFSARQVASDIGYTIGTIYHLFGTHDALLLRINAHTLDDWFTTMQSALAKAKPKRALHQLATLYIDYSHSHQNRWLALFEHHLPADTPLPDWYQLKLARFFTLLEQAMMDATGCSAKRAKRDAQLLWASIHGIAILSLTGKLALVGKETPHSLAQRLIDQYMDND